MLKNKRNFKVVSQNNNGLSDSELSDLYKIYTSMDGKHKKFKGSKEDYVKTVSELIKNFVDSSMNQSQGLVGGVKLRDILRRNRSEKDNREAQAEIPAIEHAKRQKQLTIKKLSNAELLDLQIAERCLLDAQTELTRLIELKTVTRTDRRELKNSLRLLNQQISDNQSDLLRLEIMLIPIESRIARRDKLVEEKNILVKKKFTKDGDKDKRRSIRFGEIDAELDSLNQDISDQLELQNRIEATRTSIDESTRRIEQLNEDIRTHDERIAETKGNIGRTTQERRKISDDRLEAQNIFDQQVQGFLDGIQYDTAHIVGLNSIMKDNKRRILFTNMKIAKNPDRKEAKMRELVNKEFPDRSQIFNNTRRIQGSTPDATPAGVYFETSPFGEVVNPFYVPEDTDIPVFDSRLTPSQKYQQLVDYAVKYYSFIKALLNVGKETKPGHAPTPVNKTLLRNFLIAAPFTKLTELSPQGYRERQELASHLTAINRKTLVGLTKMGWTETEEGSYRSEQFVYWGYLAQSEMSPVKRACKQYELLSKIFSLEAANERVDYNFKLYTGESKGRKTLDGVFFEQGTKRPQIDIDKIISIIAHAATITTNPDRSRTINYNHPNALFTLYKSDLQLTKYDETLPPNGPIPAGYPSKMALKVPFEVILRLNLLKVLNAAEGVIIPGDFPADVYKKLGVVSDKEKAKVKENEAERKLDDTVPIYVPKTKEGIDYRGFRSGEKANKKAKKPASGVLLLDALNQLIVDYHALREAREPKLAGKLLSLTKNKEVVQEIGTRLLTNFFIDKEYEIVAPNAEARKTARKEDHKMNISQANDQLLEDYKDLKKYDPAVITDQNLKDRLKTDPKLVKEAGGKKKTEAEQIAKLRSIPRINNKLTNLETLKKEDVTVMEKYKTLLEALDASLDVIPEKKGTYSVSAVYKDALVDLDISKEYIAKHIEVVGYSKALFTVNGVLQPATALNYSKFFVKEGGDRAWLDRYQDFTGDKPDNYSFKKIDIEAPIIDDPEGEFETLDDVPARIKQTYKAEFDGKTPAEQLAIINKMITFETGNNDSNYTALPSDYEIQKILRHFINKYPKQATEIITYAPMFSAVKPARKRHLPEVPLHGPVIPFNPEKPFNRVVMDRSKPDRATATAVVAAPPPQPPAGAAGQQVVTQSGIVTAGPGVVVPGAPPMRASGKPKSYHKKVIKYY